MCKRKAVLIAASVNADNPMCLLAQVCRCFLTSTGGKPLHIKERSSYSPNEINKVIKNFFNKWYLNDNNHLESRKQTNEEKLNYYFVSLYYGVTSLYLSKKLKKIYTKYSININIYFAYNTSKFKDFLYYKDILLNCMQAKVTYKCSCSRCNSTHVGMTG